MDSVIPPRAEVAALVPYDVPPPEVPVVLSANESPYNLPEPVLARARDITDTLAFNRYPDPTARALRRAIGARFGLAADDVIVGNGGDELLQYLMLAYGGPGRLTLSFPPTFSMYAIEAEITATPLFEMERDAEDFHVPVEEASTALGAGDYSIVLVCTPNNPTGTATRRADIERLLEASDALVLVDEAYAEFDGQTVADLVSRHANLMVLRTFSKAFSMAGLRVGFALGQPSTLAPLAKVRLPYNADAFSQAVALAALEHAELFEARWAETRAERDRLAAALASKSNTIVYPSSANFLCVRVRDDEALAAALAAAGVLVRDLGGSPLMAGCVRVTVGSPQENDVLIAAWPG